MRKTFSVPISEGIGSVSVIIDVSPKMEFILTFAHGAGAGMTHSFMEDLTVELVKQGISTVRFNFPYMEQGKKRPDTPTVAHKTIERILQHTREMYPAVPLLAGGKSFGGRMTSQYLSKDPLFVNGMVFFGFPLHPAGAPSVDRSTHLKAVAIPMLFLQGTKDPLAEAKLIKDVCAALPLATLYELAGADHSFKRRKDNIIPELAQATKAWALKL